MSGFSRQRHPIPLYPLLVAIFPILSLYSANLNFLSPIQLVRPIIATIILASAATIVAFLFTKHVNRAANISTAVLVAIIFLTFSFDHLILLPQQWQRLLAAASLLLCALLLARPRIKSSAVSLVIIPLLIFAALLAAERLFHHFGLEPLDLAKIHWLTVIIATARIASRIPPPSNETLRALNTFSLILAAIPSATILFLSAIAPRMNFAATKQPIQTKSRPSLPDVYYIVLDGYGRSDSLMAGFHFDNEPFLNDLRNRGFYIAEHSKANYTWTVQALSAVLNMDYHPMLSDWSTVNWNQFHHAIVENQVSKLFARKGYLRTSILSFPEFTKSPEADIIKWLPARISLLEIEFLTNNPFTSTIVLHQGADSYRDRITFALSQAAQPLQNKQPNFVFVHILAPHPPFVFRPDGSPSLLEPRLGDAHFQAVGGTFEEYSQGYTEQLQYLNTQVLKLIDSIKSSHSHTSPIILLQGDHGPRIRLNVTKAEYTTTEEVFPILNAMLLPDKLRSHLYPTISPVNNFRFLQRYLFREPVQLLPDRCIYTPGPRIPSPSVELDPENIEATLRRRIPQSAPH